MSRICRESSDSKIVSYDLLKGLPLANPHTKTHQPFRHSDLIDLAVSQLTKHGYKVQDTEFALQQVEGGPNGPKGDTLKIDKFFGVIDVKSDATEYTPTIGLRNSNSCASRALLSVGTRVFICDNMCFSNDHVIGHKHTQGILDELPKRVSDAVGKLKYDFERTHNRVQFFKETKLKPEVRRQIYGEAIDYLEEYELNKDSKTDRGALHKSSSAVGLWRDEYRKPCHEEFERDDFWAFQNAFTEIAKKWEFDDRVARTQGVLSLLEKHSGFNDEFPPVVQDAENLAYAI
jgi:hypothetical protein